MTILNFFLQTILSSANSYSQKALLHTAIVKSIIFLWKHLSYASLSVIEIKGGSLKVSRHSIKIALFQLEVVLHGTSALKKMIMDEDCLRAFWELQVVYILMFFIELLNNKV